MLCVIIGWLIGSTIYQRLKWWIMKKYYRRKFKNVKHEVSTISQFKDLETMIVFCAELLKKNGSEFLYYQEVDFSKFPHKVIIKINVKKALEKE